MPEVVGSVIAAFPRQVFWADEIVFVSGLRACVILFLLAEPFLPGVPLLLLGSMLAFLCLDFQLDFQLG